MASRRCARRRPRTTHASASRIRIVGLGRRDRAGGGLQVGGKPKTLAQPSAEADARSPRAAVGALCTSQQGCRYVTQPTERDIPLAVIETQSITCESRFSFSLKAFHFRRTVESLTGPTTSCRNCNANTTSR